MQPLESLKNLQKIFSSAFGGPRGVKMKLLGPFLGREGLWGSNFILFDNFSQKRLSHGKATRVVAERSCSIDGYSRLSLSQAVRM